MPQIFKVGPYTIFFWSNESDPLEPIHVHVAERANHNKSRIPDRILRDIMRVIEARYQEIEARWCAHFGQITYFC